MDHGRQGSSDLACFQEGDDDAEQGKFAHQLERRACFEPNPLGHDDVRDQLTPSSPSLSSELPKIGGRIVSPSGATMICRIALNCIMAPSPSTVTFGLPKARSSRATAASILARSDLPL